MTSTKKETPKGGAMYKQVISADQTALEMIRKKGKWKIETPNKAARAISKNGWYILHLQEGTVRNETCAYAFVKYLNEMEKTRKERHE